MAFEQKDGQGVLWPNTYKTKTAEDQKKPDYKGSAKIDGKEWALAAWWKPGRNGDFLSLSIQTPRETPPAARDEPPYGQAAPPQAPPVAPAPAPAPFDIPNDDIPF